MRHLCGVTVLLVPLLGLAIDSEALSLKVSPGRFTIHNVEPGREHDLYGESAVRVTIFNEDEAPRTWALSIRRPSPNDRWEKGDAEKAEDVLEKTLALFKELGATREVRKVEREMKKI